jgi:hypothetical protein
MATSEKGHDVNVWARAGGKGGPWPEVLVDLERALVYLSTHVDKTRAWGKKHTPDGTLHVKDISVGLEISDEARGEEYVERWYLEMKHQRVLPEAWFTDPEPKRNACHGLTAAGEKRARELLAQIESGQRPELRSAAS